MCNRRDAQIRKAEVGDRLMESSTRVKHRGGHTHVMTCTLRRESEDVWSGRHIVHVPYYAGGGAQGRRAAKSAAVATNSATSRVVGSARDRCRST